jgi:hypothetical protein
MHIMHEHVMWCAFMLGIFQFNLISRQFPERILKVNAQGDKNSKNTQIHIV